MIKDFKGVFICLLIIFLVSIVTRFATLNRPLSRHHESNPALVLTGIESWKEGGGGSNYKFVPLMNHQNEGDYFSEQPFVTDSAGNHMYLSFGPGWYVIPYFVFTFLQLPATPLSLQVLNLFFQLCGVILLFLLLKTVWSENNLTNHLSVLFSCATFIFSPNLLWYFGNGYVCTGIMLPFALSSFLVAYQMIIGSRPVTILNILLFAILCIITTYIDWYGVFMGFGIFLVSLIKARVNRKLFWLAVSSLISSCVAIGIIFFQFASYAGIEKLMEYWKTRFQGRSIIGQASVFPLALKNIFIHFITSYFPILVILVMMAMYAIIKNRRIFFPITANEKTFLFLCLFSILPYTLVFLEWSAEHEYSILPYIVLIAFLTGFISLRKTKISLKIAVFTIFMVLSAVQYYYINRPGNISIRGEPYDTYKKLGTQIRSRAIPADCSIFINTMPFPITEYYAKRKIRHAKDYRQVQAEMLKRKLKKAVWIEEKDYTIINISFIGN